jgi:hypothetical protein
MNIKSITAEEFYSLKNKRQQPRTPLTLAVRGIQPGEGFKLPCTYQHFPHGDGPSAACGGLAIAHQTANRLGFKVSCKCREGILYVLRVEQE